MHQLLGLGPYASWTIRLPPLCDRSLNHCLGRRRVALEPLSAAESWQHRKNKTFEASTCREPVARASLHLANASLLRKCYSSPCYPLSEKVKLLIEARSIARLNDERGKAHKHLFCLRSSRSMLFDISIQSTSCLNAPHADISVLYSTSTTKLQTRWSYSSSTLFRSASSPRGL